MLYNVAIDTIMLELEKQKWDRIKTVGDFLDFLEDTDADILSWMSQNLA